MRPFLPVVNTDDYLTILDKTKGFADITLGESFYFEPNGKICDRIFGAGGFSDFESEMTETIMDFDKTDSVWKFWSGEEHEKIVAKKCKELGIIFSMHSSDVIAEFKEKQRKVLSREK